MALIEIILINGVPTHEKKEVVLSTIQLCLLKGKGEGQYVLIHKEALKYKE